MSNAATLERERNQLTRLQTLLDVMYALMLFRVIAPMPIPDDPENWLWEFGTVAEFLAEQGGQFLMSIIGVILIIIYWVQNNRLFGNLVRTNGAHVSFAIAQIVFLMFYAYAMRLGELFASPGTAALQSVALAGVGFSAVAGWNYAIKDRRLLSDALSDREAQAIRISVLPEPVTALITIPIAFIGPWAWEVAWLVMLPIGGWLRRRHEMAYANESIEDDTGAPST